MDLTQLAVKAEATIKEIQGGQSMRGRLEAMGIRPGMKVKKLSSHFWRGPVTIIVGKTKVAIGHGMAQRIIVEAQEG